MQSKIFSNDLPIFFSVVLVLFSLLYYFLRRRRRLPPGPTGLPFLGYWPFLSHDTGHLQLQELGKKYGDMYSLTSAGRLYLHLGSYKAVKEVHINHSESFAHRIDDFDIVSSYFREGLVSAKGESWKMLRKFFLQQLRERGMNVFKEGISGPIYDSIRQTVADIKVAKDQPVDIASILLSKCNSIMRQALFGEDGITEEELRKCCQYYSYELMSMTVPNLLLSGKIAKYLIFPFCKHFREGVENHALIVDLLSEIIKRRKESFDENNVRDCIDAYFKEKLVRESKNDPTATLFTDKALVASLVQIIGDGIFFLSMFIVAFFKALLKYPEEQEKIYNELVDVCGSDRNPCMEDKSKLTYTNAFIAEVMRTEDTVPFFSSLQCTSGTQQNLIEFRSNNFTTYFGIVVVILTSFYFFLQIKRLPPGPTGLPFFGYWPFLKHDSGHLQLYELGKKYGDLYSLTVTGRLFLHLGSHKAVKEVHINHSKSFANRMDDLDLISFYFSEGLFAIKDEAWKVLRKFFLVQLKERGMSTFKESLSGPIYSCVRETIEDLKKARDEPVDIASVVLSKCNNIMRQTLFGNDGITLEELYKTNEYYSYELMSMTAPNLLLSGRIAKYFIIPFSRGCKEGKRNHELFEALLNRFVNRRKLFFDETNVRDCIDAYFKERIVRQSKNDSTAECFTDRALVVSLTQILGDGIFFLAIFIVTFFKALLKYPDEQDKIYEELMEICGPNRNPCFEDKSRLIYTNAFITEAMRMSDVMPLFTSLECIKETTIRGYRIPKGTVTVYNFWMAHMNPEDYEDPETFNPSRFIAKDQEKKPELLPLFGKGKRSCIGEAFSMIQAFLFVTTILKHYRLSKLKEKEETQSSIFTFQELKMYAHPRSHN